MKRKNMVLGIIGGAILVVAAAGASAYVATKVAQDEPPQKVASTSTQKITWNDEQRVAQQQPTEPECNDANIVGAAIGAVGGGLVGNQIGSGKGQDLATIGGAIGGGYLGKEYIPTHNTLCP